MSCNVLLEAIRPPPFSLCPTFPPPIILPHIPSHPLWSRPLGRVTPLAQAPLNPPHLLGAEYQLCSPRMNSDAGALHRASAWRRGKIKAQSYTAVPETQRFSVIGANLLSWLSLWYSIHMYSSATTVYRGTVIAHRVGLFKVIFIVLSSSHAASIKCTYRLWN